MSTHSNLHHGTHLRGLGPRPGVALVASLLVIGGCYEGGADVEEDLGEAGDLDAEPLDDDATVPRASCDPTMHLFPVAAAHNIGDDPTCDDYECDISCPDVNANSDWNGPGGHHGIDIFAYHGAPIVAVTSGTIVYADEGNDSSGWRVKMRDDCGWDYYYGHLATYTDLPDGHHVEAGQVIGTMGNTGQTEDGGPLGVHLHFNVSQNGNYEDDIDPFDLLLATSPTACGGEPPPPPPPPVPGCGTLQPGQGLGVDETVTSCNGVYALVVQQDGNVGVYEIGTPNATWLAGTSGANNSLWMQGDGNFVLYDAAGSPLWHTGTHGHPGAFARVEDDGNVVVWQGATPLWQAF